MLKTDYDIPIFKDEDVADLNEYSNEMASALKTQLDKFGNPLVYKGEVATLEDLPSEAESGNIYSVTSENKNYIYNGTIWVEYSSTLDLTYLENNTKEVSEELKEVTENKRLTLEGKSEQTGEPTVANPVKIRNIGDNINLFDKSSIGPNYKYNDGLKLDRDNLRAITIILTKKIKPGKYTVSFKYGSKSTSNNFGIQFLNGSEAIINVTFTTEKRKTFTINREVDKLYFYINTAQASGIVLYLDEIKLEEGSTATPYTPYGCGSIDYKVENADKTEGKNIHFPLSKGQVIHEGDYVDSIGIHQKRKTLVLTGNETITRRGYIDSTNKTYRYSIKLEGRDLNSRTNLICSHLPTNENYGNNKSLIFGGGLNEGNIAYLQFVLDEIGMTDVTKINEYFKTQYANGTPVIIEYELAEEIVTPLTKEQIEAFYELQKAKYVDKMELTCLNEIEPTLVDIEKKLEESLLDVEKSIIEIENRNIYSEDETVIGTWFGKPLYKKVINFGALPNNGLKYVKHNISNIKYVKSCTGLAMSSGVGLIVPSYNGTIYTNCYPTATEVHVKTNGDRSSFTTCYITMEYTKTTD